MTTVTASPKATAAARRADPQVVVIGAGLGGLAAAVRLLASGCRVTVVEAEPTAGGRAGQMRNLGHTFDTGPSLITMPQLLDELFLLAGTTTAAQLRMHRLDPFYRIRWRGESRCFSFNGDPEAMGEQIGQFSAADAHRYQAFLDHSRRIYERAILAAGRRSFLSLADFAGLVPEMVRLGALRSVDRLVSRYFQEPHVQQAFSFHPLFIGGDPYRVPAVYAALAYLQIDSGVWYSEGGVYSLVRALSGLVERGGELCLGDPVAEVLTRQGRVCGVRTEGGVVHPADFVISNADAQTTEDLLSGVRPRRRLRQTMSCFLLYLGTDRPFPGLAHHTLLIGHDHHRFISDVTRRGRIGGSPSLYLHAPARTEAGMAPPGGDSLSVLLPVPNLLGKPDWQGAEAAVREQVLEAMEADDGLGLEGLRHSIVLERSWTPLDFRDRLRAHGGNAFGPEPTLLQSAYFRLPNRDARVGGLYRVGASTHPGAGIPGVLLGAEVTTELLLAEARAWR